MQEEIKQYYNSIVEYHEQKAQRARSRKESRISEYADGSEAAQKALELFEEGYRFEVKGVEKGLSSLEEPLIPVVFKARKPGSDIQQFSFNELYYMNTEYLRAGDVSIVLQEEFTLHLRDAEGRKMISVDGVPEWLKDLLQSIEHRRLHFSNSMLFYLHVLSKFRDEDF